MAFAISYPEWGSLTRLLLPTSAQTNKQAKSVLSPFLSFHTYRFLLKQLSIILQRRTPRKVSQFPIR
jgi:hypothetical protein